MILKNADSRERDIAELERLLLIAPKTARQKIEQELRAVRAGAKGEQESAYLIDFDFKDAQRTVVIHDLRLEINGRVAQIDHLLIHCSMNFFVLETKHLHAGMQITEEGEFKQWNDFKKTYEGMASPLAQNERHIAVLKDAVARIELPSRAGITLSPSFHSYVLISPKARIDRPKKFDASHIIKADVLLKTFQDQFEKNGVVDTFANIARTVSLETITGIGRKLVRMHKPITIDYVAKFGIKEKPEPVEAVAVVQESPAPQYAGGAKCQECGAEVDKKVVFFCRLKKDKFNGMILCRDCQQIPEI
ncbi:MAG: NERD domain-containing protein [Geobacteraceae bacterium]|nr:NERD domain-containing protein [Geobacteraceae bacterium]